MSELGVIGDLLESSGELGLAAAVRVLEYCMDAQIGVSYPPENEEVAIWPLTRRARDKLVTLGHPEMADRLEEIHRDISHYGRIMPPQTPSRPPLSDRHRILDRYPLVRAGIRSWIDGPAPKLPGISIAVTPRTGFGPEPSIEIRVERDSEGRRWVGVAMLTASDLAHFAGRLDEMAFRHMDGIHRQMIDDLRQQPAEAAR